MWWEIALGIALHEDSITVIVNWFIKCWRQFEAKTGLRGCIFHHRHSYRIRSRDHIIFFTVLRHKMAKKHISQIFSNSLGWKCPKNVVFYKINKRAKGFQEYFTWRNFYIRGDKFKLLLLTERPISLPSTYPRWHTRTFGKPPRKAWI